MKSAGYLRQLYMLTLFVGAIPVLILGGYLYVYTSGTVVDKMNSASVELLRQQQLRVEQTLKTIDYSTAQLLHSPTLTSALNTDLDYHDSGLINNIYESLLGMQSYELGIRDVYLYSLEKGWIINNDGLDQYAGLAFKQLLQSYATMRQGSIWIQGNIPSRGEVSSEAVINIRKWPINAYNPQGMIAIVLPGEDLGRLLEDDDASKGRSAILDSDGKVLTRIDPGSPGSDLSQEALVQRILAAPDMEGQFEDKSKDVSIAFRKSAYNGWIYVSLSPINAMTRQARIVGLTSASGSLLVLFGILVVAFVGSRRMYSPVKSLVTNQMQLQHQLQKQKNQLMELLVRKLVLGEIKLSEIQERLSYYGVPKQWSAMWLVLFRIDQLEDSRFEENDRDLLLFAIANIVAEIMRPLHSLPSVVMQNSVVLLLGSHERSGVLFKQRIQELAAEVQKKVRTFLDISVSVGISRSFTKWTDASKGYAEAKYALNDHAWFEEGAIRFLEDVLPESRNGGGYPRLEAEEVLSAIRSFDREKVTKHLGSFMSIAAESGYQEYQASLLRLLGECIRLLQDAGLSLPPGPGNDPVGFEPLLKQNSPRETENWFRERIAFPCLTLLEQQISHHSRKITEEVKRIIHKSYDSDLTLEKCAGKVNYHPQYLSKLFRQETGVTFTDYLAHVRLEAAKGWLRETDMTVTEIADKLKYNNATNFIRSFRKVEGMTPGKYRENQSNSRIYNGKSEAIDSSNRSDQPFCQKGLGQP